MLLRVYLTTVDRLGQNLVDVNLFGIRQRVISLESGQIDDLVDQVTEPGGLDAEPAGELAYRRWVLGSVLHCLSQQ